MKEIVYFITLVLGLVMLNISKSSPSGIGPILWVNKED
jgi:hypothetical protein